LDLLGSFNEAAYMFEAFFWSGYRHHFTFFKYISMARRIRNASDAPVSWLMLSSLARCLGSNVTTIRLGFFIISMIAPDSGDVKTQGNSHDDAKNILGLICISAT
jgi:hypothetical protein